MIVVNRLILCLWATFLVSVPAASAPAADLTPEQIAFFETRVRPVLVEKCQACHDEDTAESKFRVDTLGYLLKGGTRGPAIVPGKPEKSLLISAINHGEILQMPSKEKLPTKEIADLTNWVKMGAPWPNSKPIPRATGEVAGPVYTEEDRQFWSFQSPVAAVPPPVKNEAWVRNPIDRFILAELEKKGLQPAPQADKRTLIRRATFDLTGLPPTHKEIAAFLEDDSPGAFATVLDRLLNSPRYGERWGRHWLDVARYADSNGMDENIAFANAFRYRDYVIRAFNEDKPYDRFVQEQLAGDLLSARTGETDDELHQRLIATGFLCVGPKMLADDDPKKKEMDIIDEQLTTLSKAFMGLTLECTRCHDHKFDPFSTADYYSLAGILKSTKTMENFKVVAEWHEYELATADHKKLLAAANEKIQQQDVLLKQTRERALDRFLSTERKRAGKYLRVAARIVSLGRPAVARKPGTDGKTPVEQPVTGNGILLEAENFQRGTVRIDRTNWGKGVGVLLQSGFAEYDVSLPTSGRYQLKLRYAAQDSRPIVLSINGKQVKTDAAGQTTGGWYPDKQVWHLEGVYELQAGKNVIRLERNGVFPHVDKLQLLKGDLNEEILGHWVRYLKDIDKGPKSIWRVWQDANTGRQQIELALRFEQKFEQADAARKKLQTENRDSKQLPDAELEAFRQVLYGKQGPLGALKKPERFFDSAAQTQIAAIEQEKKQLESSRPVMPRAMGVTEGTIQNVRIHLRGDHVTQGREVPRRFPVILAGDKQTPINDKQSGRLQFAQWLTTPKHPLTARVMVNRVWRWHFGTGLVRTPDNFGRLGERPTNQRLLDWLARGFIDGKWSLKQMHRTIMLSSAYRMSTAFNERASAADPENRLYWRFNRRRMEAEEVRDSVLAMGNSLDFTMGGQLLPDKNRAYVTGVGAALQVRTYEINRRSVYLPVLRSAVYQVFQAFDFADPSVMNGRRATTTVTPQALFMMNSQLVSINVRSMADGLLKRDDLDDDSRIRFAFEKTYARLPRTEETARFSEFLSNLQAAYKQVGKSPEEARKDAWRSLCRVLIASNEFIYIE